MKTAIIALTLLAAVALAGEPATTNAPLRKVSAAKGAKWEQHEFNVILPGITLTNAGDDWAKKLPKITGWLGVFPNPNPEDSWPSEEVAVIPNRYDHKIHFTAAGECYIVDYNGVIASGGFERPSIGFFGGYTRYATNDIKAAVALFEKEYDFEKIRNKHFQETNGFRIVLNPKKRILPADFYADHYSSGDFDPPQLKYLKYQDGMLDLQINGLNRKLLWDFQIDMNACKLTKSAKATPKP